MFVDRKSTCDVEPKFVRTISTFATVFCFIGHGSSFFKVFRRYDFNLC